MKIILVGIMPQWIISSDVAAYHPSRRVVYLKRDNLILMGLRLLHEFGHHVIEALSGKPCIHKVYDNLTKEFF